MSTPLTQVLEDLSRRLEQPDLGAGDALALAALIPALLRRVRSAGGPSSSADPRFALALAAAAEETADESVRAQIHAAHLIEASAAHGLSVLELDALRETEPDLALPPQLCEGRPSFTSPEELAAAWLDVDFFEARRRMADAHHVIAQFDYQHQQHPPQFTRLAARFADPGQHPREILSAARRLEKFEEPAAEFAAPCTASAQDASGALLEQLIDDALDEPQSTSRQRRVNKIFKQARTQAEEEDPAALAGLFRRGTRHGLTCIELLLDPLGAELFDSIVAQADNPRTQAGQQAREGQSNVVFGAFGRQESAAPIPEHPDFVTDEEAAAHTEPDPAPEPSVALRRLNALLGFLRINSQRLRKLVEPGGQDPLPGTGDTDGAQGVATVAPQVVVTLTLAELEERAATHGITLHGHQLSAAQLRRTLAEAKIIPLVLGGKSQVLDLGRAARYHTEPMRLAITVRDGGCIVPGCTRDPESCNIHHIWLWSEGGVTSVYWGAMLCEKHHHDVHAGLIKVIANGGVPQVIMPRFMDPDQRPVRNTVNQHRAA